MLTVLMPSRGRERQATEAYEAFVATKTLATTSMIVVLDDGESGYFDLPIQHFVHPGGMGSALNAAARLYGRYPDHSIFGFIGDDHRFRTKGWDEQIVAANAGIGGGIVYGNDLLRGEELPSQVFIDARVVRALGWMALPGAKHLYLDDTWRELGRAMDRLFYLPDVIVEHLHPTAGKADWDEGYRRVNEGSVYEHDAALYHRWFDEARVDDACRALAALR